jgi:hypothetical protein
MIDLSFVLINIFPNNFLMDSPPVSASTREWPEMLEPQSRLRAYISILQASISDTRFASDIEDAPYEYLRLTRLVRAVMVELGPTNGYFSGMPTELLEHIFCFTGHDLVNLSATCSLFRHVCELLARRIFLANYGCSKPDGASWCRCLQAADAACKQYFDVPWRVLYYGVSHPAFLKRIAGLTEAHVYAAMARRGNRDAITNLIIPSWLSAISGNRHFRECANSCLLETMRANDQHSFDVFLSAILPTRSYDFLNDTWKMTELPRLLDNELLPQLLLRCYTTPDAATEVTHRVSLKCATKQHIELLSFMLMTFGQQYEVTTYHNLSNFWSTSLQNMDCLEAYMQVWLKYRPKLWCMRKFCSRTFLGNKFCALEPWQACLDLQRRLPALRLDAMPSHAVRMWWETCLWPIILPDHYDEIAAIEMFDALRAAGLELGWTQDDRSGWMLFRCILQPLLQFYEKYTAKLKALRPVYDRGSRVFPPPPKPVPTDFLQHVADNTFYETQNTHETCPKTEAAFKTLWLFPDPENP